MSALNENKVKDYIRLCESRYYGLVRACADRICNTRGLQYVALCGPTCSGKTTTASILINELEKRGYVAEVISIDDFFRDRDEIFAEAIARGDKPDLDSVKAIDLDALRHFMQTLEAGNDSYLPGYDFVSGKRRKGRVVTFRDNAIYIFEGIQAFYPEVVSVFKPEELIKIFISVEDPIETDGGVLSAREVRLMRRMLRDSRKRGTDAPATLNQWEKVVQNELLHIDPHSHIADMTVNSAMPYEVGVMREDMLRLLATLPDCEIKTRAERIYNDAEAIDRSLVPENSVIREFIGWSKT